MWPCCDFTSSDDDEHNTDNNFLLLFADIGIMPNLLDGLDDVDVLNIALGCRFALDILSHSIILPPLSLILYLTILSSFNSERCSHIVVLSSSSASWLAQCGFGCLEFCVRSSQSVISCAPLTLREAGTCAERSWSLCSHLCSNTHCSLVSSLSLVLAFVYLCSLMYGVQMPPGTTECNHSYYTGNSFSAPHFAQQLQNGTLATPAQPPASIQEVNGPASSGFVSSSQLSRSAISSQVTVAPTRNGTGGVIPLAEAITQISFLEFLKRFGVSIAPPQPPQSPVSNSLLEACCADDYTL